MDYRVILYPAIWVVVFVLIGLAFYWFAGVQDKRAVERKQRLQADTKATVQIAPVVNTQNQEIKPVSVELPKPAPKPVAPMIASQYGKILPHDEWWPMAVNSIHMRLIGQTGSGKSVMAQALASEYEGKLVIIDPVWKKGNWGGLPAITVSLDGELDPIERAIDALIAEMKKRGAELQQVENPVFERLTILFDEVPDTVTDLPEKAGLLVRRIGQRGRHGNMHLIGMGQSDRVKSWGIEGYGDAADNFGTILLGSKAVEKMAWLADASEFPAILEIRGKFMPIDTSKVLDLSSRKIDPSRIFELDYEAVKQGKKGKWTPEHQRVADALEENPSIGKRELARILYPGTRGDGNYFYESERLRREVETMMAENFSC